MPDLSDHGIDMPTLRKMHDEWVAGATKSELERKFLDAPQAHGKLFSSLVREHLGIETERRSPQSDRIAELEAELTRLRSLLAQHGIDASNRSVDGN